MNREMYEVEAIGDYTNQLVLSGKLICTDNIEPEDCSFDRDLGRFVDLMNQERQERINLADMVAEKLRRIYDLIECGSNEVQDEIVELIDAVEAI